MTMTPLRSMPVLLAVLICAILAGCARRKPVLVMPQEPPPATAPTPANPPQAQQEPPQAQPSPTPQPGGETQGDTTQQKSATRPKPHPATKKPSPQVARNNKTVVNNGGVPAPAPSAPSPEQASQQAATEQLLQSTENAIKGITRQLSQEEQAMLTQIHDFINQSRLAIKDNDFARAQNLAMKAHLLSDELAKRK